MKNGLCFIVLLLVGWLLQPTRSWGQEDNRDIYLKMSIDLPRLVLEGPSYDNYRSDPDALKEFNFAWQYVGPVYANEVLDKFRNTWRPKRRSVPADPATLLASTNAGPGVIAPPDKPSFLKHLSWVAGIQLIGKGGKVEDDFGGTSVTRMTYLEPMAYVLYNYDLPNNKGHLFGGPGLYLAYGLWGKETFKGPGYDESFKAFDTDNGGYKRFDAGLAFTAGYQLPQSLRLSLEYELGLVNIESGGGEDKTRNRVLSLNVAYPLKKITDKLRKK